jgi:hypothetical protein
MKKHLTLVLALLTILSTSAHAQLPSYLPADGLVGWWPFNGNANDESGNGNDGVLNGAISISDHQNNPSSAYQFGSGRSVSVPMTNSLFQLPQRSFVCWFRANGNQGGGRIYETTFRNGGIGMYAGNTLDTWYGYSQHCCNIVGMNGGTLGEWHHLVSIANDVTGLTQVYLDGGLLSQSNGYPAGGGCIINSAWQGQYIRFGLGASNESFNGDIDDIAIYNRALTEQEIQNLYTGSDTGTTTDSGNGAAPLPQGIPYQAAARDGNGQPVVDSPISVRFSLREGAADGAASYIESHCLTTNSIGLFNTVFGNGTPVQSAFDSINWAATTKFLQVEVDLGNGYVDMGTTQLLSVPYAFRSAQAANIKNAALPVYPDNTAALAGGLVAGEMYRTTTGDLKIVY